MNGVMNHRRGGVFQMIMRTDPVITMKIYPKVSVTIGGEQLLSSQELKACILLLLDFSNSEIISLLNVSSQGMTNIKTRINEKLFDESNAVNLTQKLKNIPMV